MTAHYENWSDNAQRLSDRQYVTVRSLSQTIDEMMLKNWSLVEARQQAIDIWGALPRLYVFSHEERMPEFKTYVDLTASDYPKVVAQMMKSLSHKEASKHRNEPLKKPEAGTSRNQVKVAVDTGHTEGVVISYASDDDAKVAYYEALRTIETQVARGIGLLNRTSFETEHNLKWVEKPS